MTQFEEIKETVEKFWTQNPQGVVIVWGATATGKTGLSVKLSDFFDFEVISSDSRQIFRDMNVGTDKISAEIRAKIPHHQIDIINPDQHYTAGEWQEDTIALIEDIQSRGKKAMIVGGTGLYIDTVYKNFAMPEVEPDYDLRKTLYDREEQEPGWLHKRLSEIDPESAAKIHANCSRHLVRAVEIYEVTGKKKSELGHEKPVQRPILMLGLRREKEATNELIDIRIKEMLHNGLLEEVQGLLDAGYSPKLQSMQGIGYKETVRHIQGKTSRNERIQELRSTTHHLAKKQRSWFRRYMIDAKTNPKENVTYATFFL